jgi:hypothetical protein
MRQYFRSRTKMGLPKQAQARKCYLDGFLTVAAYLAASGCGGTSKIRQCLTSRYISVEA